MVQFKYGDDALDPAMIEGELQPIEFPRSLAHILVPDLFNNRRQSRPPKNSF
jgi:hypothetical protein